VKEVEKTKENVEIFYNLMCETTARDDFHGNTLDYYFIFLNELENSKLLFAEFE
jgi:lipid II:glycine glycyltransferase (peptidoglycan interpeptide bridge formation enzyme)